MPSTMAEQPGHFSQNRSISHICVKSGDTDNPQ